MAHSPLLDHCPPSLPAHAYHDAAWAEAERRTIWSRNWVYVGRLDTLTPGTMRRVALAGENLILLRDAKGAVSAFHNTCRHRGAELCRGEVEPLGTLITCPYHAWAYATDGRLISTGFATPTADFRRDDHRLSPVAVQLWNGMVFLCLADDPPAFAPDLGTGALDNWPMADLVTGHVLEKDLACNWKIFWENYNECLHCPGIHPELSERVPVYRKGVMAAAEHPDLDPTAPILSGTAQTWTVSGSTCGPVFPRLSDTERRAGHFFVTLYPTAFIVAHVDYVRIVSLLPLGPEAVRLRAEWLFAADTMAAAGFDLADVTDFATMVMLQDAAACEMNQRGLRSRRFAEGRLMPQEFDVHAFQNWVRAQMRAEQTEGDKR